MSATIRDIAREAGVSTATVSRVLNSSVHVNEETKEKPREKGWFAQRSEDKDKDND